MRKSAFLSAAAGLALCVCQCLPASAVQYSITEIPQMTHAVGVNRNGVVVGGGSSPDVAFVYVHSSAVLNELPEGFSPSDINDLGQIIGTHSVSDAAPTAAILYVSGGEKLLSSTSYFRSGQAISNSGAFAAGQHIVIYPRGVFFFVPFRWQLQDDSDIDLPLLGTNPFDNDFLPYLNGDAAGVNDEGVVVGSSNIRILDAQGQEVGIASHAVRWQDGTATDLGTLPGGTNSGAHGINDRGEIVGDSDTRNGTRHAYLLHHHKMLDLGTLEHDRKLNSAANRINDRGEIVGWSEVRLTVNNSVVRRAFISSGGRLQNLAELIDKKAPLCGRVTLTEARAISSNGWIAADGFDDTTQEPHAYLLVPHGHESKR